jgi:hypothetical protein
MKKNMSSKTRITRTKMSLTALITSRSTNSNPVIVRRSRAKSKAIGAARLALLCTKADYLERMNIQPSKKKAMRVAKLVLLCSKAEHLEMMITHFSKKKAPAL